MYRDIQEIRESQFVLMYGPGALIETKNGTRLIPEINHCLGNPRYKADFLGKHIFDDEIRMSSVIRNITDEENINLFSLPSNTSQNKKKGQGSYFTYVFPSWKLCNKKHDGKGTILYNALTSKNNKCPLCQEDSSVNVRFVLACSDGHLDDIPWHYAVHRSNGGCSPDYYLWNDRGSSFSDIVITCPDCGATTTMDDIYTKVPFRCTGRYPEIQSPLFDENNDSHATFSNVFQIEKNQKGCKKCMKIVQKQSTSLRIPYNITLLKMQKNKDPLVKIFNKDIFKMVRSRIDRSKDFIEFLEALEDMNKEDKSELVHLFLKRGYIVSTDEGYKTSDDEYNDQHFIEIKELVLNVIDGVDYSGALYEEFATLIKDKINEGSMVKKSFVNYDLEWLDYKFPIKVAALPTLKTVTAQLYYHREPWVDSDENGNMLNKQVSSGHKNEDGIWYPAYEGSGEGIFITSDYNPLNFLDIDNGLIEDWRKILPLIDVGDRPEIKNPLFVWWHTLSHALINSLSLSCGYNSTSLKERIYIRENRAGILIYNTSPGEDSGMGGLIETVNSFGIVLKNAMNSLITCSNDPLCFNEYIAKNRVNGAACHNCLLISETSCEHRNTLLDRHFFVE